MTRFLLSLALAAALAVPAEAQTIRHRIVATTVGNTCQYRIATQSGQEVFTVSPGDRLRLQGLAGTKARFEFLADDGVAPLARGSQTVDVRGNGETVRVRAARGADSEHEVAIRCCMDRHGNTCNRWARATPAAEPLGMGPGALPRDAVSGPSASGEAPPRLLGPRMKVDE